MGPAFFHGFVHELRKLASVSPMGPPGMSPTKMINPAIRPPKIGGRPAPGLPNFSGQMPSPPRSMGSM